MRRREMIVLSRQLDGTLDRLISLATQLKLSIDLLESDHRGRPHKEIGKKIDAHSAKWPAEYDRTIADLQVQRARIAACVRVKSV
jgi:hypothetical protein